MQQLADVHGHHDLRLGGIGQHVARIFCRNACIEESLIRLHDLTHQPIEGLARLGVCSDALGLYDVQALGVANVALALLVEACQTMAYQLMGERSRDAIDGEGVARMLQRGSVTALQDGGEHFADALVGKRLHGVGRTHWRIAQACCSGHSALGVGRMVQQLYLHLCSLLFSAPLRDAHAFHLSCLSPMRMAKASPPSATAK